MTYREIGSKKGIKESNFRYSWSYNYDEPGSIIVQHVEMVIELGTILISAIFYMLTICYHKNVR